MFQPENNPEDSLILGRSIADLARNHAMLQCFQAVPFQSGID
jgi:hypothetical protein